MQDETDFGVSFVSLPGMAAIEVIDPIERHRYRLETPEAVSPEPIRTDSFRFPVDRAVAVSTRSITLPSFITVYVRTRGGDLIAEAERNVPLSLDADEFVIELNSPVKLYLELEGAVELTCERDTMSFEFGETVEVAIGARSAHRRPETTVVTTTDPTDMMAAISTFGSALKTTSPERSFPTLRGHPPRVEVGDTLDIPAELTPPETGITLGLRPSVETVFAAASLAYYLGATVEPAESNQLLVDGEVVLDLGEGAAFETAVEDVLQHTFLLDCVVRTEGLYPVELNERTQVEQCVPLDIPALYEASIADRLLQYLEIPFDTIRDIRPRWGTAAHILANPYHVELLPYVVDDLATIRVEDPTAIERPDSPLDVLGTVPDEVSAYTRSSGAMAASPDDFVKPPQIDCVEQLWIGEGTPIGASKAIPEAFENRLERTPSSTDIDLTVICNDDQMNEERGIIDEIYGSRDDVSFDVTIHQALTKAELREVLTSTGDFLHYIGHIDDDGFECADGKLDLADVESVNVSAFLLNACQSYRQGRYLIEKGAIGGIVTLSDVVNEGAIRIGGSLAQLLNLGFPLYAALRISRQDSLMGGRYIVIGDGRLALTQAKSVPVLNEIHRVHPLEYTYTTFPSEQIDMGSLTIPFVGGQNEYFLISSVVDTLDPTSQELLEYFQIETMPVYTDGQLAWSTDIEEL